MTANLRLVVKIAHEYRRAHRNLLDLIQEGNVGLVQAVKKYDPYRGVKLSSYAAWWIRAYMLKFILNNWRLVKIGTTQAQRKLFFNLRKEKDKLEALGFDASSKALAEALDVPEREVIDMERRLGQGEMSLDAPLGERRRRGPLAPRHAGVVGRHAARRARPRATSSAELLRQKLEAFEKTLRGRELTIFRERLLTDDAQDAAGDRRALRHQPRARAPAREAAGSSKLKKYLRGSWATRCRSPWRARRLSGTLYVVATPIGNLEDITLRALRILREVAVIAAEDTRSAQHLLTHSGIARPTIVSFFEGNEAARTEAAGWRGCAPARTSRSSPRRGRRACPIRGAPRGGGGGGGRARRGDAGRRRRR